MAWSRNSWNRKPRLAFTLKEFPACKMCIAAELKSDRMRGKWGKKRVSESYLMTGSRLRLGAGFSHSSPFLSKTNVIQSEAAKTLQAAADKPHFQSLQPISWTGHFIHSLMERKPNTSEEREVCKRNKHKLNPVDCCDWGLLCVQTIKLPVLAFICCLFPSGKMVFILGLKRVTVA